VRKEPSRYVAVRLPSELYWRARRLMVEDPERYPTITSVIVAALEAFLRGE
jgi:hypothetical protein